MKQLKNKINSAGKKVRGKFSSDKKQTPPPDRITNDTVAQHREQILTSARKFKYPMQHSKHRIVLASLGLIMAALLVFVGVSWYQLYRAQATGNFMHRVTMIFPVPVATVDGEWVRYSDYLTELRSSMHYLSTQEGVNFRTEDGKRQLEDLKSRALSLVTQNALIAKYAREEGVTVSNEEVDTQINNIINQQAYADSEDVYRQVIREYYNLTYDQWRDSIRKQILRNKVYAAIDQEAQAKANTALEQLEGGRPFADVAREFSEDTASRDAGGDIGTLEEGAASLSPELQQALFSLEEGEHSEVIPSKQGLFILNATEVNGNRVRTGVIFIKYNEFNRRLEQLQSDGKIDPKIDVKLNFQAL